MTLRDVPVVEFDLVGGRGVFGGEPRSGTARRKPSMKRSATRRLVAAKLRSRRSRSTSYW
ncbi:hypothetical protein HSR121_2593 [Halapricum desulfuricans]|uniref:Uncharacterized protein n=1 Tax=Halapricum desulfuricans TaxID=2841257 RepID=A0A897N6T4_9EURY|nr:hypothetical protein HSR121_2593 [Halapricum desulfuricans]